MLSRVAETLYWTARYVERAENLARLINVNNLLLMDLPKGVSPGWEPLIDIIGNRETFEEIYSDFSEKNVLKFLTIDSRNPSSIINSLQYARDNARTIRDVVPREMWEAVNRLHMSMKENSNSFLSKRGRFASLKEVINQTLLIFGTMDATMSHDEGYFFWRFGSALERADMTSRIIDVRSSSIKDDHIALPFENIQWMSVLRSLSGYQMYRQKMGVRIRPGDVLKFMLHGEEFPRSVMFCLHKLKSLFINVPDNAAMIERIDHSITELEKQPVANLQGKALHDYIDELQIDLADIHQQLSEQYFLH
ncbi:alpha-E domain-containing protein [Aestuariibacter salexigens]|uniref:alpha-E domain-containing protein n=1 Tax=Aestuariibacter salexigens TaxID=226010 RepID=UPI0003FDE577|nr:alpha-E domain-containing protein [Aestuariibacter salexigens]